MTQKAELKALLAALKPLEKAVGKIPSDAREVVQIYPYGISIKTADLRKVTEIASALRGMSSK